MPWNVLLPSGVVRSKFKMPEPLRSCRTIDAASSLINLASPIGFKRSGIITLNRRIIVEITSPEKVDAIIGVDGRIVVDDDYLKLLIKTANSKLELNLKKIKKFLFLFSHPNSN